MVLSLTLVAFAFETQLLDMLLALIRSYKRMYDNH